MIEQQIIDSLDPDAKKLVINAFKTLSAHEIWLRQLTALRERLWVGSDSEELDVLSQEILQFRRESQRLQQLHTLGLLLLNDQEV